MNLPAVTVTIVTYNHAPFVRQTIESVLAQKTSFPVHVYVADDCSQDGTGAILDELRATADSRMKVFHRPTNMGMADNFLTLLADAWASGCKYIAHLDGDDYWSDPEKLQKQVDYLESHPECVLSTHNSHVLGPAGFFEFNRMSFYRRRGLDEQYKLKDYLAKDFFHSSSMVYRNGVIEALPAWYKAVFSMDYFLVLFLATKGDIHFRNECMSVYRTNPDSISHYWKRVEILENTERHLMQFSEDTGHAYRRELLRRIFAVRYGVTYYSGGYWRKVLFYLTSLRNIWTADRRSISLASRFKFFLPTQLMRSYYDVHKKKSVRTEAQQSNG